MIDRREDIAFNTMSFPSKLYALLEDAESQGFSNIISWQTGGRSFNVHNQDNFAKVIMPSYFSQTKFKSFQRQLNIYGWKKVQIGPNKGGYEQKHFIRGQPELCDLIFRKKDNRQSCREPKLETFQQTHSTIPIMDSFMPLDAFRENGPCNLSNPSRSDNLVLSANEVKSFYNFFYSYQQEQQHRQQHLSPVKTLDNAMAVMDESLFSLAPTPLNPNGTMTSLNKSASIAKFSLDFLQGDEEINELDGFISLLDDLSEDNSDIFSNDGTIQMEEDKVKLDNDDKLESDHSFPFKLHLMLDNAERDCYSHIVSWVNNGTAFKVHDSQAFVDQVMPNFFDQSKYESFRRQLNLYQFKRVAKGNDRGVISHPNLIQGSRHLCKEITKRKNEDGLRLTIMKS